MFFFHFVIKVIQKESYLSTMTQLVNACGWNITNLLIDCALRYIEQPVRQPPHTAEFFVFPLLSLFPCFLLLYICIFRPAFGCCTPQTLVEIVIFSVFVLKSDNMHYYYPPD